MSNLVLVILSDKFNIHKLCCLLKNGVIKFIQQSLYMNIHVRFPSLLLPLYHILCGPISHWYVK